MAMDQDDPSLTEQRQQRLEELRSAIAVRLAAVCREWPTEMFEEMVRGLAALTYKYEHHSEATYDRRSTDRLLTDMKDLVERSIKLRTTPRSSAMQEGAETD